MNNDMKESASIFLGFIVGMIGAMALVGFFSRHMIQTVSDSIAKLQVQLVECESQDKWKADMRTQIAIRLEQESKTAYCKKIMNP